MIDKSVNYSSYPSKLRSVNVEDFTFRICSVIQNASGELWKERCKITTEWETAYGITKDQKRKAPDSAEIGSSKPKRVRLTKTHRSTKLESHADKITTKHKHLEDVARAMDREPEEGWEFANPTKKIKKIHERQGTRCLPTPETEDDRLENIYTATETPVYNPSATDPLRHGYQMYDEPTTSRRKGGLSRPGGK